MEFPNSNPRCQPQSLSVSRTSCTSVPHLIQLIPVNQGVLLCRLKEWGEVSQSAISATMSKARFIFYVFLSKALPCAWLKIMDKRPNKSSKCYNGLFELLPFRVETRAIFFRETKHIKAVFDAPYVPKWLIQFFRARNVNWEDLHTFRHWHCPSACGQGGQRCWKW